MLTVGHARVKMVSKLLTNYVGISDVNPMSIGLTQQIYRKLNYILSPLHLPYYRHMKSDAVRRRATRTRDGSGEGRLFTTRKQF